MLPLNILKTELNSFIEELRRHGYNIGIEQFLQVQQCMQLLLERGEMPTELRQLRLILRTLLCHSIKEQAMFDEHFERWLHRVSRYETPIEPLPTAAQPMPGEFDTDADASAHISGTPKPSHTQGFQFKKFLAKMKTSKAKWWGLALLILILGIGGLRWLFPSSPSQGISQTTTISSTPIISSSTSPDNISIDCTLLETPPKLIPL